MVTRLVEELASDETDMGAPSRVEKVGARMEPKENPGSLGCASRAREASSG